jgi:N-methylhydantoinase B
MSPDSVMRDSMVADGIPAARTIDIAPRFGVNRAVDPITLTVLWKNLISIAEEMGSAMRRTAFSEAVREGDDFSAAVFDRHGRMIAQGNFTPGHLGSMPYAVRNMLNYVPLEELGPGDTLVTNDSALGSGHYPDFFFMMPVFDDAEELIGFVVNTAHHIDVGGATPGSQGVQGTKDTFAEGIRVLPVKLISKGVFDASLMRVILGNVRLPDKLRGDLRAQANANNVGAARLKALFAEYGRETMDAVMETILDHSEARARELIRQIPEGTYSFEDRFDDCGPGTDPVHVRVDMTFRDGGVTVDFSRSSDQVPAGLNCYLNYSRAYAMFGLRIFAGIDVPQNAGVQRVMEIVAREGCFFNAQFPAASGGRASCQIRIFDTINGAMAQVRPDRAMGAFSHWANPNFGGVDPRTGKRWIMYDLILGGYGGRHDTDGPEAFCPVFNCANIPVEVHETINPIRIERFGMIADTGGPGRFRGGCGMRKDVEVLCDDTTLTLLGDRHVTPPYGLFGGGAGAVAQTVLIRDGAEKALGSKEVVQLQRGDIVSFRLAGAGGYGDPKERDPVRIREDLRQGYVTADAAARVYGVSEADLARGRGA